MSAMMDVAPNETAQQPGVAAFPPTGMAFNIKRAGGRPLRFEGSELAMAMSFSSAIPYWYEINVYRKTDQRFVTAVRLFYQSDQKQDTVRAWENASIDDAIDKLVRYDAAYDVPVSMELATRHMPPSELAAHALQLQAQISEARHHYKSLLGEFLYEMEGHAA